MMRSIRLKNPKVHAWIMLFCALIAFTPPAMAQNEAGTRWIMSYEDANRTFKLNGEVVQKNGTTELKWASREPAGSDDTIERLPTDVPNWQFPQTKNTSETEIVFEFDEMVAVIRNGEGTLLINGNPVDKAIFAARIQSDANGEISQRVSVSHFIQMLGGATANSNSPLKLGLDIAPDSSVVSRYYGLRLHLFNPQAKGHSILWDWKAQHGFDANFGDVKKFQGSVEGNNPIVWGPSARIEQVFVVSEQRELTGNPESPIYPKIKGLSVERNDTGASNSNERELIILGHELDTLESEQVLSSNPGITYSNFKVFDASFLRERLSKLAPEALNNEVLSAVESKRAEGDLQAYWVTATISKPLDAGLIDIFVDDLSAQWPLLYGGLNGLITIVRPKVSELLSASDAGGNLRAKEQPMRPLYFRDEVVIQAKLDTNLDRDTINIKFVDDQVVLASTRNSTSSLKVPLKRVEGSPRTYRSQSFILANKETFLNLESAKKRTFIAQSDDGRKQTITLPGQDIYEDLPVERTLLLADKSYLRPRFVAGENIDQLEPYGDAQVLKADETIAGDFIAALKIAAECKDRYADTSWDKLSVEEERSISIGVLFSHGVPVSFGHHAAAIMLRAKFLETLGQHQSAIGKLTAADVTDPDFVKAAGSIWNREPSPISLLAASERSGLLEALKKYRARGIDLLVDGGTLNPQIAADFRNFLKRQNAAMQGALKVANTPDDCNLEALLKMTGKGFAPIVEVLKSTVSRIQTNRKTGVQVRRPDMVARRALDTLAEKLSEYDAVSAFGDRQKEWIGAVVSTVGLASGVGAAYYGSSVLVGTAIAADSADFVMTCAENACGSLEDYSNLKLAKGSTSVLGDNYLTEAEKQATSAYLRLFNVGLSGFVVGNSANGLRRAATNSVTGRQALIDNLKSTELVGDVKDAISTLGEFKNRATGK